MAVYTTEIASETITSDNPIHQRLLKAYVVAADKVQGNLLEVGCGEGRGVAWLMPKVEKFSAIDKIATVVEGLKKKFPQGNFVSGNIPPLPYDDNTFDCVVSFQVIEHIKDDNLYLKEISRVLKPGGFALITTPNRPMSLSRNPWHEREYAADELTSLAKKYFSNVEMKGVAGNEKVMQYHERNKKSVNNIMRWDIFDLQHKLPASILRMPYEMLNRLNRNKLKDAADDLVASIRHEDYVLSDEPTLSLDLFLIARK
ncbi:MAG TPA: class I SAM-dependent methyltransferase [Cyclobacteriaceae bacterium]|jgi:ubiquinone/menaquinone biosynthesis C-methylase UbiE|nr:class I SAM-dependent methyltransferase [Cyclobacteriaceae bacterium]